MIIPHDQIQPQTLRALIEEYVTRDGAVHGHSETPTPRLIESVLRQLRAGRAVIVFDEESESCTIVAADQVGSADDEEAPERQVVPENDAYHDDEG